MKAPKLVHISSVLFSLICILQGIFLCIYSTIYLEPHWVFLILFFILASFMALYFRFQKYLRRRFRWLPEHIPEWDIKSSLWCIWLAYSIGLVATIAVIFCGVVERNHDETCWGENDNFSGIYKNVTMCRTKENEIHHKGGMICGSATNETFCWKAKSKTIGLLKTDEFFGPNVLKITLCATPVLMLLLLKSARAPKREGGKRNKSEDKKDEPEDLNEDDDLKDLYFRATLNLFDGMEMLEELLEHGIHGADVPQCLETAILVCVCIYYSLSFLELLHLAFRAKEDKETTTSNENNVEDKDEEKRKNKWRLIHAINTGFQILLNVSFFILRMIMWLKYNRDAAIFLAKNLISIVMNVMPYVIASGCVDDKSDDDDGHDGGNNDESRNAH